MGEPEEVATFHESLLAVANSGLGLLAAIAVFAAICAAVAIVKAVW